MRIRGRHPGQNLDRRVGCSPRLASDELLLRAPHSCLRTGRPSPTARPRALARRQPSAAAPRRGRSLRTELQTKKKGRRGPLQTWNEIVGVVADALRRL